jgi:butyrate kinase
MKDYLILAINPGSTSTKISVFHGDEAIFVKNIKHAAEDAPSETASFDVEIQNRKKNILNELGRIENFDCSKVDAFVGRGGGLKPCAAGTYEINDLMILHTREERLIHPARYAPIITYELAKQYGKKAFVVDSPAADELIDEARFTGLKEIYRQTRGHTLNQKEAAHRAAAEIGKKYADANFIVAHLGGGFSITAHRHGRMIDTTDAIMGEGPMSPTRCGGIGVKYIIDLCFSGKYSREELNRLIMTTSGLTDHLGVSDGLAIENLIKSGDKRAKAVYDAMIFQIAKSIGAMAGALEGDVDAVVITGGLARDKYLVAELTRKTKFVAPFYVYPGEFEMEALTNGALRVLRGEDKAQVYTGIPTWQGFEWDRQ